MFRNPKSEQSTAPHARKWKLPLAVALIGGLTVPAFAHHSYVMFNRTKVLTVSGTVSAWNWTNPHISLRLKSAKPGQPDLLFEGASPSIYQKAGVTRKVTAVGEKVTITYHPMADGSAGGQLLLINGKGPK